MTRRWVNGFGVLALATIVVLPQARGRKHEIPAPQPPTAIIVLENKSAANIVGNASAPFLNSLISLGTRFTNYREADPRGPSLPDYLQLVAGSSCGRYTNSVRAPDLGISRACPTTLWNQLNDAGRTWKLYQDMMPSACFRGATFTDRALGDQYALKHDPGPMFASLPACARHVVPFSSLDAAHMPNVSLITPSICDGMHGSKASWAPASCVPGSTALVRRGDRWLAALVPRLLANGVVVFVTFDESGVLYAAAAGPGIPAGATDGAAYTHYSWLRAVERRYGLSYLGGASIARPLPI